MRPLRFIALTEDAAHLVLGPDVPEAIDNGERFLLPIDDRLRAAARGDMSRLGQIEIELESTLRPREIQARIRAGDTPEQVASVAGIRVEKVMRYAYPVLRERERTVDQARLARVRLADGTPATALGEFMVEKLTVLDADHRSASWDARRLDDGVWEVVVGWSSGKRRGVTRWWFDNAARSVTPADAETSAFAERPRGGQSMIVAPQSVSPDRPLTSVSNGPDDARPAYDGPEVQDLEPPVGPEYLFGRRDDEGGAHGDRGTGERGTKPRVPSWEDIVFGVRRKRS